MTFDDLNDDKVKIDNAIDKLNELIEFGKDSHSLDQEACQMLLRHLCDAREVLLRMKRGKIEDFLDILEGF